MGVLVSDNKNKTKRAVCCHRPAPTPSGLGENMFSARAPALPAQGTVITQVLTHSHSLDAGASSHCWEVY